ncbi:MAG: hypothetical protein KGJ90_07355 [Patescibacteria group bacterium]|nr:hypothetical protein [Patescibacteria group bacterium]
MLKDDDKKSYIEVGREEWERLRQDAKNEITRKKLQEKIREREQRKAKRDKDIAEWKAVQAQIKVDEAEERRQAKERKKQEKEQAKAGPYRQPRLFSRERQQAQANAKRQAIAARKEQREIERLRKYEQKIQDNMKLNREREIREALKGVKIRPFQKGKDESLYRQIPKSYRSKDSAARSMDEIADELSNNYPYLNIHSSSDLAMAFEQLGLDRRNRLGK